MSKFSNEKPSMALICEALQQLPQVMEEFQLLLTVFKATSKI